MNSVFVGPPKTASSVVLCAAPVSARADAKIARRRKRLLGTLPNLSGVCCPCIWKDPDAKTLKSRRASADVKIVWVHRKKSQRWLRPSSEEPPDTEMNEESSFRLLATLKLGASQNLVDAART